MVDGHEMFLLFWSQTNRGVWVYDLDIYEILFQCTPAVVRHSAREFRKWPW